MKTINNFESESAYKEARFKYDANHAATMQYCKDNKTNGIPCEIANTFPYANKITNELRSKIETYEFMQDKPDRYFIYIDEKENVATTWTGDKLGIVHFGKEYRSNMNDKRINIDVIGINGIKYHGTYFKSSGDYARIKAYKK